MPDTAAGETTIVEAVVFLSHFKDLPDPRQRGKVLYPLDEILLLCLVAVLGGAEAVTEIVRFGEKKLDLLRRFRPFTHGVPCHDQLGTILATLDAVAFQQVITAPGGGSSMTIDLPDDSLRSAGSLPWHISCSFLLQ